eukprot:symbB.v1.2.001284.t1/scaffold68.1/size354569/6
MPAVAAVAADAWADCGTAHLEAAEERFKSAARLAVESGKRATLESLRRVRAREKELDLGNAQVQVEEIQRMGALLGDEEAGYWVSCVGECSRTAEGFLNEDARQRLMQKRLVVVDEAVPLEAVQLELQRLRGAGIMQNDTNDVCNPLQEAKYLPFAAGEAAREFREKCPTTMEVMQKLAGLACILEDELGRLAVPQSAMAACYPPRAAYKMHLDSYFLQGCKDDIPRKVTVLLYCNHAWEKRMGGELRTWEPFDQGRGKAQVIEPLAGRLVVFLSEEIWHEVSESHADRYALTVWMHDRDRSGTLTETTDGC